jgi:hypothetical protein
MPLAPPVAPTDAEVAAILERCKAAIDERRDPLAVLTAEEHQALINLHINNPAGGVILLSQLRDHAEHNPVAELRWRPTRVQRISFQAYVQAARVWHEARQQAQRTSNVLSLADARNGRQQRPRGPLASLNPAEMITMSSPRMRGIGLLRSLRQGRIWYDEFYKRVLTDWDGTSNEADRPVHTQDDEFIRNVALWMVQTDEKLGNSSDRQVDTWIKTMADMDKRNEPRDWLNSLTWDGTERLRDVMVRGFGAVDTAFNIEVGRCWFVGMVARIMRPGCQLDTMPVLIGPQGIFKSQALRVIGGDWYRSAVSDIHSKDFKQELFGAVVFEIPELHSLVTSNAAAAKVKAVISNQVDHFRQPYGMTVEEHKRTACMCGTTNNRDWHHDESGARRFWPVHCGDIDLEWLREHRAQLFAEARAYFDLPPMRIPLEGDDYVERRDPRSMWWNVPEAEQRAAMEDETSEDVWQGMIEGRLIRETIWNGGLPDDIVVHDGTLSESADWGNLLTTARIAYSWLALNSDLAGRRATSNRIGSIMRNLGWARKLQRIPNIEVPCRIWLNPDAPAPAIFTAPAGTVDDADIPF